MHTVARPSSCEGAWLARLKNITIKINIPGTPYKKRNIQKKTPQKEKKKDALKQKKNPKKESPPIHSYTHSCARTYTLTISLLYLYSNVACLCAAINNLASSVLNTVLSSHLSRELLLASTGSAAWDRG